MPLNDTCQLSLLQMKVIDGDAPANLTHLKERLQAAPSSDLYLLPEVWTTGYARSYWPKYISSHHDEILSEVQGLADERQALIGGSYIAPGNDGTFVNRFLLHAPGQSAPVGSYDKAHLFSVPPLDEVKYLSGGRKRIRVSLGGWVAGLSICYDLRFPEGYRLSACEGVSLFLIAAQWPRERCDQMAALARARAIENQAYVALCNRIGQASGHLDFGWQSGIWAPDGRLLAGGESAQESIVTARIDLSLVAKLRQQMPILSSRIPHVDFESPG